MGGALVLLAMPIWCGWQPWWCVWCWWWCWQRERNRIKFIEGILFDGFNTKEDFEQVREYARDLKVLTWSDPIHFKLSISSAGIDNVRAFIQNQLASGQ